MLEKTPEASNSNSHSHVCGSNYAFHYNTDGVEYDEVSLQVLTNSTPSGVEGSMSASTTDATVAIGIKCFQHLSVKLTRFLTAYI